MKNFQIWENEHLNDVKGMLISSADIYKAVNMYNISCMSINGVSVDLVDKLTEAIKKLDEQINDITEMEEFLTEQEIEFSSVEWLPDLPVHQKLLYFDTHNQQFDDLLLCDYISAYDWWNGNNHKNESAHDSITVTIVDTEDDPYLDLDKWDHKCNGYCTGGQQFYHEVVYKVINLNGEKVRDAYLLRCSSQWQGSHPQGVVLNKDELDAHLKEIGYRIEFREIKTKKDAKFFVENVKKFAEKNEGGDWVLNLFPGTGSVYSIIIHKDHWECEIQGENISAPPETIPNEIDWIYKRREMVNWSFAPVY